MSSQRSFTDIEYSRRRRITRREKFLKMMDELIPWGEWIELIRPHYPEGKRGRRPLGIDVMLRMYSHPSLKLPNVRTAQPPPP